MKKPRIVVCGFASLENYCSSYVKSLGMEVIHHDGSSLCSDGDGVIVCKPFVSEKLWQDIKRIYSSNKTFVINNGVHEIKDFFEQTFYAFISSSKSSFKAYKRTAETIANWIQNNYAKDSIVSVRDVRSRYNSENKTDHPYVKFRNAFEYLKNRQIAEKAQHTNPVSYILKLSYMNQTEVERKEQAQSTCEVDLILESLSSYEEKISLIINNIEELKHAIRNVDSKIDAANIINDSAKNLTPEQLTQIGKLIEAFAK